MKRPAYILIIVALCALLATGGALMVAACGSGNSDQAATSGETLASTTSASSTSQESSATTGGSWTSPAESVATIASPSVVNVRVTGTTSSRFFGDQPYEGIGSGVVYSSDGYIITNEHVVTQDGQLASSVEVTFSTGETAPATIVATDSYTDIAVIKVDMTDLTPATFATDDSVTVGEYAIAIGSPLDYSNSVTLGVVSGLGRSIENSGSTALVDLIQTDAAISPGNSGGALLDAEGRVIGINVAYMPSSTTGAENIGFAIPVDTAVDVAKELINNGSADHAYMGVSYTSMSAALQQRYRLSTDTGVLVTQLDQQGPAAAAGLEAGDIITAVDDQTITSDTDLIMVLREHKAGDGISVTVDRNGQTVELTITLGDRTSSSTTTVTEVQS